MLTASDIAVCMRLPPEKIIEYLAKKEVFISWDWHDLWQEEHAGAKTIAKVTRLDILQDIYNALEKAAAEGKSGRWFRKELEPVLQAKGWWGRITDVNPDTGEEQEIQAGSPWRLDTIFRTNMSMVHSGGRWAEQIQNADDRPYGLYVAIRDSHTRPVHLLLDGTVLPLSHPFWQKYYPPNGWGCRCSVITLTAQEVKERGLFIGGLEGVLGEKMQMVSRNTGEMRPVATWTVGGKTVSPDPGFSYNPGVAFRPDLNKYSGLLAELAKQELSQ